MKIIGENLIPFEEPIEDCDIIENSNKYALIYRKDCNGYFLVTSDASSFLPKNERFSTWKKK